MARPECWDLLIPCIHKRGDDLPLLLKTCAQSDVMFVDEDGRTLMYEAAKYGNYRAICVLERAGLSVDWKSCKGFAPIHMAAWNGHSGAIDMLLMLGARVDAVDNQGATALHLATRNGRVDCATLLARKNASVTAVDIFGRSPLHIAAAVGSPELVDVFVRFGADVCAFDHLQDTPLHSAVQHDNILCVKALGAHLALRTWEANCAGQTPLHVAASGGSEEMCAEILALGYDSNGADCLGRTPLHYSLIHRTDCVALLLREGASVHARDFNGCRAAHWAASCNHASLGLILKEGSCPYDPDTHGNTPLHYASKNGSPECVRTLLDTGVPADVANADGNTPAHLCSQRDDEAEAVLILRMLLDAGSSVSAMNNAGETPVLNMLCADYFEGVAVCMAYGAACPAAKEHEKVLSRRALAHARDRSLSMADAQVASDAREGAAAWERAGLVARDTRVSRLAEAVAFATCCERAHSIASEITMGILEARSRGHLRIYEAVMCVGKLGRIKEIMIAAERRQASCRREHEEARAQIEIIIRRLELAV